MTITVAASLVVTAVPALAIGQWTSTGSMHAWHNNAPMAVMQDGRVMMASGDGGLTEVYNSTTGQWDVTGNAGQLRDSYNPVVLDSGKVLIAGGNINGVYGPQSSAQLYDPVTGQWTPTGSLNTARACANFVKLPDGRVLAISGSDGATNPINSAELYDPATGQWSYTGNVAYPIFNCQNAALSVVLNDGRVLVALAFTNADSTAAQLYDPATGHWTPTGNTLTARVFTKLVKLNDGRVLMIGGTRNAGNNIAECELYHPATGSWTATGSLVEPQGVTNAALLPDGRVLIAGGQHPDGTPVMTSEIYDPVSGQWATDAGLNSPHIFGGLTMLPNGTVLLAGGYDPSGPDGQSLHAEVFTDLPARQLTAVAPAEVWIGLKNSDDVGTRFDLRAEVYTDTTLVTAGQLSSIPGGSSGFNNAHRYAIAFDTFTATAFPVGSQLRLKLYVRNACAGPTHNSGTARLWYNDEPADSRFGVTVGTANTAYYLRDGFALATTRGPGPKKSIDVASGNPCSAFKPFGTWTIVL